MAYSEAAKLKSFLARIQLDHFLSKLIKDLHVIRIEHLEHVIESDLVDVGMSLPEIRRLFDHFKKNRKNTFFSKLKKTFGLSDQNLDIIHCDSFVTDKGEKVKVEDQELFNKCVINEKDIILKELLGNGAFGFVHQAEWLASPGKSLRVAVKSLQVGDMKDIPIIHSDLVMEANAMITLNHPNLIRLYGVILTSPMMLVTELAPLGSLLKRLREEPEKFLISTLCSFVVQIIAGMKYLEKHRFVHRDLATRNCLLMTYEKVKIGDFGLSRPIREDMEYYIMQPEGKIPFAWCAPECLKYRKFSHASDMWAFGVTMIEIFTYGAQPWAGLNGGEILERIDEPIGDRLSCPKNCPKSMYSVINDLCWKHEDEDRATFAALEKEVLLVLPYELTATFTNEQSEPSSDLQFEEGDVITAFDNSNGFTWKCQNRRTLQIGYLSDDLINIKSGTVGDPKDETKNRRRYASESEVKSPQSILLNNQELSTNRTASYNEFDKRYVMKSTRGKDIAEQDSFSSGYESPGSSSFINRKASWSYHNSQSSCDSGCRCSLYSSESSYSCPYAETNQSNVEDQVDTSQPIDIPYYSHIRQACNKKHPLPRHSTSSPNESGMFLQAGRSPTYLTPPKANRLSSQSFKEDRYIEMKASPSDEKFIGNSITGTSNKNLHELVHGSSNKSLPEIVQANKKTAILQRRRSLPRLKRNSITSFENKLFNDDLVINSNRSVGKMTCSLPVDAMHSWNDVNYQNAASAKSERSHSLPVSQCMSVSLSQMLSNSRRPFYMKTEKPNTDLNYTQPLYDVVPSRNNSILEETGTEMYENCGSRANTENSFENEKELYENVDELCVIKKQSEADGMNNDKRTTTNKISNDILNNCRSSFDDALLSKSLDTVLLLNNAPTAERVNDPTCTNSNRDSLFQEINNELKSSGYGSIISNSSADSLGRIYDTITSSDSFKDSVTSGIKDEVLLFSSNPSSPCSVKHPMHHCTNPMEKLDVVDNNVSETDLNKSNPIKPPRLRRNKSVKNKKCVIVGKEGNS